jgi:hypothetical protein
MIYAGGPSRPELRKTGLEAAARAYAKIIDEVNKLPLSTFRRAEESQPTAAQPLPPAAGKLQ